MQPPEVKGDGKIILSFKDNQCVVETQYDAPVPPPPVLEPELKRDQPSLPFNQTILAGNPQGSSSLNMLVIFQAIAMIVGMILLIAIGVYLIYRDQQTSAETQNQLRNQDQSIQLLKSELQRLSQEIKSSKTSFPKEPLKNSPLDPASLPETPTIETNNIPPAEKTESP